ncbi:putative hydrolase R7 [Paramyrothecium foliicola]|nr:putative hydrolase R7 [Paramyrothecium foliicola]
MASENHVILLIGGGWHTPKSYSKLVKALESAGHEIHCPRHPSMDQVRPPKAGLIEDSDNMRAYAQSLVDSGRRVVAVLHSYGGQVGTKSLVGLGLEARSKEGKAGGVSDLVYMAAFALPEGGTMAGKVKEMGHEALMPLAFEFADDMTVLCRDPKTQLIGDTDLSQEEVTEYLESLVRWNGQCMYEPVSHSAWRDIPVTYIYTTNDMTVPLDYQKSIVTFLEEQGKDVKTYEINAGHCPNLTATNEVVDIIGRVMRQ